MDVKHIVDNLIKDIQDIEKFVNSFANSPHIPPIEIDLLLSRLRNLYDAVLELKEAPVLADEETGTEPAEEKRTASTTDEEKPVQEEEGKEEETVNQDFELEGESPAAMEEAVQSTEPEPDEGEKIENAPPEKKHSAIVADRFAGSTHFRNEELGKTFHGTDLSSKLQSQPLKDIGAAIGINDRFYYIRELFHGDAKKFDSTITLLNDSRNFNEAFNYLSENYNWDMDDPAVQNLLELIRRKHIISSDE